MIIKLPKVNNFLYAGILMLIIKVSFGMSSVLNYNDLFDSILNIIASTFLIIHILLRKFPLRIIVIYLLISLVTLYSAYKTGNYWMLISVITCLAVRGANIHDVIQFMFRYQMLFFVLHFIYALLDSMIFSTQLYAVIEDVTRYHFGMGHPNRFSVYLFNLMLMWVWLYFDKIKWVNILLLVFIQTISYFFTMTRTNLIEMYIILFVIVIYKINQSYTKKAITAVAKFIVPVLSGFTMIAIIFFLSGSTYLRTLDTFLSGRIRLGAYAYLNYGLSILGQNMQNIQVKWDNIWQLNDFTFDNTYSFLIINQGIIWLVLLSILFYYLAKKSCVKNNVIIIAWALYGLTEVHGMNVYMSFPIILLSILLSNNITNKYDLQNDDFESNINMEL